MCSSDTLIPTTPPVDIMVITYTLLYALHLELLHTRFAFCCLAVVVVACRIRCTSTAGSIGRLFVRDKQETSCRKIMAEGDSAAPISPTTTDSVQGLHSSPRPLATTTTTLAPRLEILQNRPGSVEIAFFLNPTGGAWRTSSFLFTCLWACVLERRTWKGIDVSRLWIIPRVSLCRGVRLIGAVVRNGEEAQGGTRNRKGHGRGPAWRCQRG
ncbi:hypothetical protein HD554DRAFT_672847 [Boletus coccyginus]|nr:hypothetical protein HD554DRAFT_672847 [Boletus coccyginus]